MTSHREATKISKDPVADNTDLYAFVSPDRPDTVTILANYIPLEEPAGGPNFNTFGDDVLYEIMVDNDGDGIEDVTYQFKFKTKIGNPDTFLYNTGPISSLTDSSWNVKQFYSVTKVSGPRRNGTPTVLGTNLSTPPVNIGPRSTPNYIDLANAAINTLSDGSTVFAGQRDEAFYVDFGSIFDLATLRPFQNLHLINQVIIPIAKQDDWNTVNPRFDSQFLKSYQTPEVQKLLPILYPGVFPNLAGYSKPRADLIAILLPGVPSGIVPGFQNFTGS